VVLPWYWCADGIASAIFIRLVKTIIVQIIFATLVVGIAGYGDLKAVGRYGG
jgi:proton glutamate symport protein